MEGNPASSSERSTDNAKRPKMARGTVATASAGAAVLIGILLVGFLLLNNAGDRFVKQQAERISLAWASYLGAELPRIEALAGGAELSEDERAFLRRARQFGDVFRFKLFDPEGRLRLVSDYLDTVARGTDSSLGKHNAKAAAVIATGRPYISLGDGRGRAGRPDLYAEAYVPIMREGRLVAVSEVYIDGTGTAAFLGHEFQQFGLQIVFLTLLAVAVPGTGLVFLAHQLRRQNRALDRERRRAVEAEQAKSTFLANMSHELRTPLNAVVGMSQMMVRGDLGPLGNVKYREYAQDINASADLLLSLINDILDLSKVNAGKYELDESAFDLAELVRGCLRIARAWKNANRLEIANEVPPGIWLCGDQRAFKQILLNLLSNSVKFTPGGGSVEVAASVEADGWCAVVVRDTGCGIAADEVPRVIEPFNQSRRRADLRQHEGTGLGLSLAASLVELHGGALRIESKLGVGTVIRLRLPPRRLLKPTGAAAN